MSLVLLVQISIFSSALAQDGSYTTSKPTKGEESLDTVQYSGTTTRVSTTKDSLLIPKAEAEVGQAHTVTAAMTRANGQATYLFYADGTYAKTHANKTIGFDGGYPQKLPGGWQDLPADWLLGINAALPYEGTSRAYMWRSGEYLRLSDVTVLGSYPKLMPGGWRNMPKTWRGNVDAAIHYRPNNKHYFFKGGEYIRLTGVTMDAGYPRALPGGWRGMPSHFAEGVDAATYRNGHVYMIKGDSYIRFSGTQLDEGYPKPMSRWPE